MNNLKLYEEYLSSTDYLKMFSIWSGTPASEASEEDIQEFLEFMVPEQDKVRVEQILNSDLEYTEEEETKKRKRNSIKKAASKSFSNLINNYYSTRPTIFSSYLNQEQNSDFNDMIGDSGDGAGGE